LFGGEVHRKMDFLVEAACLKAGVKKLYLTPAAHTIHPCGQANRPLAKPALQQRGGHISLREIAALDRRSA